jgi:hypothetical protein
MKKIHCQAKMMGKFETQSTPRQMKQKRNVGYYKKHNQMRQIKSVQQVSQNDLQNYLGKHVCSQKIHITRW